MPDSKVLLNAPATLSVSFDDGGEALVDPGTVTVTITQANGTAIVTGAATTGTGAAARTYALAARTSLDRLTAVWTGSASGRVATTHHDVVGGYVVPLSSVRTQKNLADIAKFTAAELGEARSWFEDLAEEFCDLSFIPRFRVEGINGDGSSVLRVKRRNARRLSFVKIDGVTTTITGWDLSPNGTVLADASLPVGVNNIEVGYEHGLDAPPADVARAALVAIRWRLLTDEAQQLPDRATSMTNEFGNVLISQPGGKRATGIPEVDSILSHYQLPGVA